MNLPASFPLALSLLFTFSSTVFLLQPFTHFYALFELI